MQTNIQAALDFLEQWRPEGPWVLTAISPDRTRIRTATLSGVEEARRWVEEHSGELNCYFHVNPTTGPLRKKAEREDIAALAWLHVDIDPREGEDIEEERERALRLLRDPPGEIPPPTCIVFSGGGYQGFWRLEDPLPIDGDLERAEDAKLYNLALEMAFGADHCHNVDRIMRLPGTVNIPDKKKLAKGRSRVVAELVEFNDQSHPLSAFEKAEPIIEPAESAPASPGRPRRVDTENVQRLSDVHELDQWGVPDRVKVIVVQGRHPDEVKTGDDSRSAWLFDVVCNLVRAGVPDDVIYAVITDPDFGISESVLAAGSPEKYALRQIRSAKQHAIDPMLAKMNERFAVVKNIGGKCRVVEEVVDPILNRHTLSLQPFGDFRNAYCNTFVEVGKDSKGKIKKQPLGDWWLRHSARRQYDRVVFAPEREVEDAYNLWTGFSYEPVAGDCSLYLDHVRRVICRDNEEHYEYLLSWMARVVQRPASPGQVAIVMRGEMGTGKGFFVHQFGSLFGRHYMQVTDPKHLVGNFNIHLRDCLLLFGDEAFYAGDKKHESVLKALITEDFLTVEAKGVDVETAPNLTHIMLASNNRWVVPAGASERRFLVLDVDNTHRQDTRYFAAIKRQMTSGGREALLHLLLNRDLSGFEVRVAPRTAALSEQQLLSLSPEEEWWFSKLQDGVMLPRKIGPTWPKTVLKEDLLSDYVERTREYNVARRGNPTSFGQFLRKICPGIISFQGRRGEQRPYFYKVPELLQCREAWDERYGALEWPEVEEVSELESGPEEPF